MVENIFWRLFFNTRRSRFEEVISFKKQKVKLVVFCRFMLEILRKY